MLVPFLAMLHPKGKLQERRKKERATDGTCTGKGNAEEEDGVGPGGAPFSIVYPTRFPPGTSLPPLALALVEIEEIRIARTRPGARVCPMHAPVRGNFFFR